MAMSGDNHTIAEDTSAQLQKDILMFAETCRSFVVPIPMRVFIDDVKGEGETLDILGFSEKKFGPLKGKPDRTRVYLDPEEFPIDSAIVAADGDPFKTASFKKLLSTLNHVAGENGIEMSMNGSHGNARGIRERVIACSHYRVYNRRKQSPTLDHASAEYRTESYVNDRLNRRQNGHIGMKKRTTSRGCGCKFRMTIRCDKNGFYIPGGMGNPHHIGHYRRVADCKKLRSSVIDPKVRAILHTLATNHTSSSALAAVGYEMSGVYMSRGQLRYFRDPEASKRRHYRSKNGEQGALDFEDDDIIDVLKKSNCVYCVLFHTNNEKSLLDTIDDSCDADPDEDSSVNSAARYSFLMQEKDDAAITDTNDRKRSADTMEDADDSDEDSDVPDWKEDESEAMLSLRTIRSDRERGGVPTTTTTEAGAVTVPETITTMASDETPENASGFSLVNEVHDLGDGFSEEIIQLPVNETAEMEEFAFEHRAKLKVPIEKDLLVGVAWVHPAALRVFRLSGKVVHIDCTCGTNNERRPLLTCSCKDTMGHNVIFLRAFLPNERAWIFRWLFLEVFPLLLGERYVKQINAIITDGDSTEIRQLDEAIRGFFPNITALRCGWHLVDRGVTNYAPGLGIFPKRSKEQRVWRRRLNEIKAWMYTFMKAGSANACETMEEFQISKWLLLEYIKSDVTTKLIGKKNAKTMLNFLNNNFFIHELRFAVYLRLHLRHFDEYSNSAHEGLNNGMKRNGSPVMAGHTIERSAKVQIDQTLRTIQQILVKAQTELLESPNWTCTATSRRLVRKGESELDGQRRGSDLLQVFRVSRVTWRVTAKDTGANASSSEKEVTVIPKFRRVRKVCLDQTSKRLTCTCGYFGRMGLPCRHQIAVIRDEAAKQAVELPIGYVEAVDVCVVWWAEYCALAGIPNCNLSRSLLRLSESDVEGPKLPGIDKVLKSWHGEALCERTIDEVFHILPAKDRILNYKKDTVLDVYSKHKGNGVSKAVPILTQDTNAPYEDDAFPIQDDDDDDEQRGNHSEEALYCHFKSYVQELVSIMEDTPMPARKEFITGFLKGQVLEAKSEALAVKESRQGAQKENEVGIHSRSKRYVSSSVSGILTPKNVMAANRMRFKDR